jgi:signal transduction histidine kinase
LRLAEFIHQKHEVIISEWVSFARTLLPPGRTMSTAALRDHAAAILVAIVEDMKAFQSARTQTEKAQGRRPGGPLGGAGRRHALGRIETGFRLDQVVAEYRALRASILKLWAADAPHALDPDEVTRFNEAIDETLSESTRRYMETLDRHRDQFLGILGHDLRNPLGSIIMGASVLAATDRLDDRSARIASRILHSARRMDRLVGDLLDLTRTRLGAGLPITRGPVDLARVCRQVIAELRGAHPDAQVRFEAIGDLQGRWDADRLAQVVSNVVGNAIQHGQLGRPVTVVARGEPKDAVLEVHNEGPPIPHGALAMIFEPMSRAGASAEDARSRSLGLGLYVAQQVVLAHTGKIDVSSSKSEGTTFTVRLPRDEPAEHQLPVRRAADRPKAGSRATSRPRRVAARTTGPRATRGAATTHRSRPRSR